MQPEIVFFPIFAHMLLVFILYIKLGARKRQAVKAGLVDRKVAALDPQAWTEDVIKVSNCIRNQFEVPILFYALSFIAYLAGQVNFLLVIMLVLFVISRYLHAHVHINSNFVPHRFRVFLLGMVILLLVTIWLAVTLTWSML